jgi:hypothetical protein
MKFKKSFSNIKFNKINTLELIFKTFNIVRLLIITFYRTFVVQTNINVWQLLIFYIVQKGLKQN